MAVSLVSTGVQFPDSTIQTTAASASPWVTLLSTTVSSAVSQLVLSLNNTTYSAYNIILSFPNCTGNTVGMQVSTNGGASYFTGGYILNGSGDRSMMDIGGPASNSNGSASCMFYTGPNGGYITGMRMNTYGASSGGGFGFGYTYSNVNAIRFISGDSGGGSPNGNLTGGHFMVLGLKK